MFKQLNYRKWIQDNRLAELMKIYLHPIINIDFTFKMKKGIYENVSSTDVPFPSELDDLCRLHYLARTRKVTTILEFGVGKSTVVLADALRKNKELYGDFVTANLRRANPFEIHSVDASDHWIGQAKRNLPDNLHEFAHFMQSEVRMTTFNDRVCTKYDELPNICPDLIYLDAPDLFSVKNDIRGISTASQDRVPMAADILYLEPFLLPGTLIVIDGRTANARFLKNNFQRDWRYIHYEKEDIHTFELVEKPLGKLNALQIKFCLGRIKNENKNYY